MAIRGGTQDAAADPGRLRELAARVASTDRWALAAAAVVVLVVALLAFAIPRAEISQDTTGLISGTHTALRCVHAHEWSRCGVTNGLARDSQVGPFPLLQYLPVALMIHLGFADTTIERALSTLSLLSLAGVLGLLAFGLRKTWSGWRLLLPAIVLSGSLLYYGTSPFGEMLAAALVLACMVAVIRRNLWLIALLGLAAGLGKETLPYFVFGLGLVAGRDSDDGWLPPWQVIAPLVGGSAAAVAIAGLFNRFRFGSWGNSTYLQKAYDIDHSRSLRDLWNLLASPGGGMIWFWSALVVLLVALGLVSLSAGRSGWRQGLGGIVLLVTLGGFVIGLALWWSPFGWVAWGPRLDLPIVPAGALLAVHAGGDRLAAWAMAVLSRAWSCAVLAALMIVAAWPEAAAPWRSKSLTLLIEIHDGICASYPFRFSRRYYDCIDHIAWRHGHNQLLSAFSGNGGAAIASQLATAAAVALLVWAAHRQLPSPDGPPESTTPTEP